MTYSVRQRLLALGHFVVNRLAESSTWQGLGFLVTFAGVQLGTGFSLSDPESVAGATAAGALVSAALKIFLPDQWPKS